MALFRRKTSDTSVHPITEFWLWWSTEGNHVDPHRESPATAALSKRVAAIHPDLAWHFGPGSGSQHRLTVSASGVAEVRPYAERWLRAAPPANDTWEFRASQEADPDALKNVLTIAGEKLALVETVFRVEVDDEELRVHVGVHHPSFAQLPDGVPAQFSFLVLDWLLGEDDVERWLGAIEPELARPVDALDGTTLRSAVDGLKASRDPEAWTLASWQEPDGSPGLASFRRGLRWLDQPTFDRHHVAALAYRPRENGLPEDADELDRLREVEDRLEQQLGGRGLLVGHETSRGTRVFHVYTDSEDQNVDALLGRWANEAGVRLTAQNDPGWKQVRHLTG